MPTFQQRYANLHDDELVDLALTRELVPEAKEALRAELIKRGITNLSPHRAIRESEAAAEEHERQVQLAVRDKAIGWRTKFIYFVALFSCAYGIYRLAVPNKDNPGDDGGIMLVLGIAAFIFGFVTSRLSKLWGKHVLHR